MWPAHMEEDVLWQSLDQYIAEAIELCDEIVNNPTKRAMYVATDTRYDVFQYLCDTLHSLERQDGSHVSRAVR